jgi:hypothetical protein
MQSLNLTLKLPPTKIKKKITYPKMNKEIFFSELISNSQNGLFKLPTNAYSKLILLELLKTALNYFKARNSQDNSHLGVI